MDDNKVGLMALRAWKSREGALVNVMMHLGATMGIFAAMPIGESTNATWMAERTGYDNRWLHEWLRCMAAADFIETDDGFSFVLSAEGAAVLVDDSNPAFAGGAMRAPMARTHVEAIANAIRTGTGFTYGDLGTEMAENIEAEFAPAERAMLVSEVVPVIPGLAERLHDGGSLVDIGCGTGHTLALLADAFPSATFAGYDPSIPATDIARERFAGNERVNIHTEFGHDLPPEPPFDAAFTFDCLHDMPRPDLTLAAIHRALRDDGVLVVKEIRSSGDFRADGKNPVHALMYAASLSACLASATSTPDGLGLGTLGLHPEALEQLCLTAGFSSVTKHDVGDPVNLFYEVRP